MNPGLVAVVWVLVLLDCALMGYRLAMGRDAVLDKRDLHRRSALRAAAAGLVPLAIVTAVAVALAHGDPGTAGAFDDAMRRFAVVGLAYAAVILGTWALCVIPSLLVRTAASVVIFGPLTLLRPVVVVATVAAAIGPDPTPALVVVGVLVAVPGVLVEPLLDRRIARRLVAV